MGRREWKTDRAVARWGGADVCPADYRLAVFATDRSLRIWDGQSNPPLGEELKHVPDVLRAAWSRDGKWLAAGGTDGKVHLWDTATWQPLHGPKRFAGESILQTNLTDAGGNYLLQVTNSPPAAYRFYRARFVN